LFQQKKTLLNCLQNSAMTCGRLSGRHTFQNKGVRYRIGNSGIKSAFTGAKDRTDDLIKRSENSAAKSTYDWDRFPLALLSCGFWRGDSLGLIAAEETWKQERPHWTNNQPKSIL
jgi:hypothetical protein